MLDKLDIQKNPYFSDKSRKVFQPLHDKILTNYNVKYRFSPPPLLEFEDDKIIIKELEKLGIEVIADKYDFYLSNNELYISAKLKQENKKINKSKLSDKNDNINNGSDADKPKKETNVNTILLTDDEKKYINIEIWKRKIINCIIEGESKLDKKEYLSNLSATKLKEIFGDNYHYVESEYNKLMSFFDSNNFLMLLDSLKNNTDIERQVTTKGLSDNSIKDMSQNNDNDDDIDFNFNFDNNDDGNVNYDENSDEGTIGKKKYTLNSEADNYILLLHEISKSLFSHLGLYGLNDIKDEFYDIILNKSDTVRLEIENFSVGPILVDALNTVIYKHPLISKYRNIKLFLYERLFSSDIVPSEEFISIIDGVLSNDLDAIDKLYSIIDDVITLLDYDNDPNSVLNEDADNMYNEFDETEFYDEPAIVEEVKTEKEIDLEDYSKMSKRELDKLVNYYLENSMFDKLNEINKFL